MSPLAQTPRSWYSLRELLDRRMQGVLCVPWPESQPLDGMDPYLAWLDATHFVGTPWRNENPGAACPDELPVLVKVANSSDRRFRGGQFVTVKSALADIVQMRPGIVIPIPTNPPQPIELDVAATVGLPRSNNGAIRLQHVSQGLDPNDPLIPTTPVVIAVIDDGCPFAREGLRRTESAGQVGMSTRVLRLWDQGTEGGPGSTSPPGFDYGSEWSRTALEGAMRAAAVAGQAGAIDEDSCYTHLGLDLAGDTFRHGAHMLGLVAGDPAPWRGDSDSAPRDAAAEADVLFVQLPRRTMADTSGGSLPIHVLDALRWIDERTRIKRPGGDAPIEVPVIINLCIGASAGPHDGSSLIEQAIDDFLDSREHAMVVMAGGNTRGHRQHASWRLDAGQSLCVPWDISPDDATDNYLELWWTVVEDEPPVAASLEIRLVPPGVDPETVEFTSPGEARFVFDEPDPKRPAVAGVVSAPSATAKGEARCVLLCVGPTASDGVVDRPLAVTGAWQVHARNSDRNNASIQVDAWIERDDSTFGSRASPSAFAEGAAGWLADDGTLGSLAHGRGSLVVGGYVFDRLDPRLGPLQEHSGEGPGRAGFARSGPDVIGPGGEQGQVGVLSWGVHSGEWVRIAGTSAAAAAVTRRMYNSWMELLMRSPPLPLPSGASAIKKALEVQVEFDATEEPLSRVGRGRIAP